MNIQELTLLTNDLNGTKVFYEQKMGFQKITETPTSISFAIGTSKLIFELIEGKQYPTYHFAFNIPSNKIDESIKWILERTALIATDNGYITDFENWKAKAIYFFDNNHNLLEFICREDLNNQTDKAFSVTSILNINEIGLVTDQPLKTGDEIIAATKTDYFAKGPKREDFAAVGDDKGLFVIASSQRNWYPTNRPAQKWHVKATITIDDQDFELEFN